MGDVRSILFVCLSNVCRSPMAEAVFMAAAKENGVTDKWFVDSAGTAVMNKDEPITNQTKAILDIHGIHNFTHLSKNLTKEHFNQFDYIMGMDEYNIKDINIMNPNNSKAKVCLFGSFDNEGSPYIYDLEFSQNMKTYETLYQKVRKTCESILKKLK